MGDSFITVTAILLAAMLMFVFPIVSMADKVDTASQTDIETMTSEFINKIKTTGKLTPEEYSNFMQDITSTGNTYDIELEFKILDENPGKKTIQSVKDKIGENVYYSVFTTQIEEVLQSGTYYLSEGDIVSATVRNTNLTLAQQMKDFFYSMSGSDVYTIQASQSGLVTATGTT